MDINERYSEEFFKHAKKAGLSKSEILFPSEKNFKRDRLIRRVCRAFLYKYPVLSLEWLSMIINKSKQFISK